MRLTFIEAREMVIIYGAGTWMVFIFYISNIWNWRKLAPLVQGNLPFRMKPRCEQPEQQCHFLLNTFLYWLVICWSVRKTQQTHPIWINNGPNPIGPLFIDTRVDLYIHHMPPLQHVTHMILLPNSLVETQSRRTSELQKFLAHYLCT